MEQKDCYNDSIKLLAKRDYSIYKLSKKLLDKGHPRDEVDSVIEELLEKKYLREENYIEARVKGLIHKCLSKTHIQNKMKEEKCPVDMEIIDKLYNELKTTEQDQIQQLIEKKYRFFESDDPEEKYQKQTKVLRHLISKGHSYDLSKKILSKLA